MDVDIDQLLRQQAMQQAANHQQIDFLVKNAQLTMACLFMRDLFDSAVGRAQAAGEQFELTPDRHKAMAATAARMGVMHATRVAEAFGLVTINEVDTTQESSIITEE